MGKIPRRRYSAHRGQRYRDVCEMFGEETSYIKRTGSQKCGPFLFSGIVFGHKSKSFRRTVSLATLTGSVHLLDTFFTMFERYLKRSCDVSPTHLTRLATSRARSVTLRLTKTILIRLLTSLVTYEGYDWDITYYYIFREWFLCLPS